MYDNAYEVKVYYRELGWNQDLVAKRLRRPSRKQEIGGSNPPKTLIFKSKFQAR